MLVALVTTPEIKFESFPSCSIIVTSSSFSKGGGGGGIECIKFTRPCKSGAPLDIKWGGGCAIGFIGGGPIAIANGGIGTGTGMGVKF